MELITPSHLPVVPQRIAVSLYNRYSSNRFLLDEDADSMLIRLYKEDNVMEFILQTQIEREKHYGLVGYKPISLLMNIALLEGGKAIEISPRIGFTSYGVPILSPNLASRFSTRYASGECHLEKELDNAGRNLRNYNSHLNKLLEDMLIARKISLDHQIMIKYGYRFIYNILEQAGLEAHEFYSDKAHESKQVKQFEADPRIHRRSFEIRVLLNAALQEENFEEAARLKKLIDATGELL